METVPTARFRALVTELGVEPGHHFDALSPRSLWIFLDAYALAVPSFQAVLDRVSDRTAREERTRLALPAGALLYLSHGDTPAGYRALLQRVAQALPASEANPEREPPLVRSFRQLLPTLAEHPHRLLQSGDVREWADFVRGLHRGLLDRGIDASHDRALLGAFERGLQQRVGVIARWDRLVFTLDGGKGHSLALFLEEFEAWQAERRAAEAGSAR